MLSHIVFFYFVLIYHCLHCVALLSLFYVCVLLVIYYYSCLVDFGFCSTYLVLILLLSYWLMWCHFIVLLLYSSFIQFASCCSIHQNLVKLIYKTLRIFTKCT
jgi:hypothetical protein